MNSCNDIPGLVSTQWLADRLGDPGVVVVDASFHLPNAHRHAMAEYRQMHIQGAVFFDIETICDPVSPYPHMLPDESTMSAEAGALGMGGARHVVTYDSLGVFSSPRLWWMLRTFGHRKVSVLDGGLPKWRAEQRPVDDKIVMARPVEFAAKLNRDAVRDMSQIMGNLKERSEQVIDARSAARFHGIEKEPRPGLRSGHIPGALNLPFANLLTCDSTTMLSPEDLQQVFLGAGVNLQRPVVASCGSGVSACIIALGLHLLDHENAAVYDGSWSEWGARTDTPIDND